MSLVEGLTDEWLSQKVPFPKTYARKRKTNVGVEFLLEGSVSSNFASGQPVQSSLNDDLEEGRVKSSKGKTLTQDNKDMAPSKSSGKTVPVDIDVTLIDYKEPQTTADQVIKKRRAKNQKPEPRTHSPVTIDYCSLFQEKFAHEPEATSLDNLKTIINADSNSAANTISPIPSPKSSFENGAGE